MEERTQYSETKEHLKFLAAHVRQSVLLGVLLACHFYRTVDIYLHPGSLQHLCKTEILYLFLQILM